MKKNTLFLAMLILSLFGFQCTDSKNSTVSNDNTEEEMKDEPKVQMVQVIQGYTPEKTDNFEVISASVEGDILTMLVSYGGGCEEHEFDLIFNGAYKKSLPPQIDLFLKHNANEDRCRAMVQETLKFNIAEVKGPNKTVIMKVNNYKDRIEY